MNEEYKRQQTGCLSMGSMRIPAARHLSREDFAMRWKARLGRRGIHQRQARYMPSGDLEFTYLRGQMA